MLIFRFDTLRSSIKPWIRPIGRATPSERIKLARRHIRRNQLLETIIIHDMLVIGLRAHLLGISRSLVVFTCKSAHWFMFQSTADWYAGCSRYRLHARVFTVGGVGMVIVPADRKARNGYFRILNMSTSQA